VGDRAQYSEVSYVIGNASSIESGNEACNVSFNESGNEAFNESGDEAFNESGDEAFNESGDEADIETGIVSFNEANNLTSRRLVFGANFSRRLIFRRCFSRSGQIQQTPDDKEHGIHDRVIVK